MTTQEAQVDQAALNLVDSKSFRQALGHFPTGVAIVTTRTGDGHPVGLTINSFTSLSLDPPLIMWSLDNRARSLSIFENCNYFAINIISSAQVDAAMGFANPKVEDKFGLVSHADGEEGVPLIDHCVATFVCKNYRQYEGGDHTIFIGRVVRHNTITEQEPAVFHRGKFTRLNNI